MNHVSEPIYVVADKMGLPFAELNMMIIVCWVSPSLSLSADIYIYIYI